MKIYDCFTFFNELDLLEIRLSELEEHVDYFVLVEARKTHAGNSKKLYYEENKERFKKWEPKIIHIIADLPRFNFIDKMIIKKQIKNPSNLLSNLSMSYGLGRMKMDHLQRKNIKKGIKNANSGDVIIVSDLDEIPNPKEIISAINLAKKGKVVGFNQKMYYYFLNGYSGKSSIGTKLCSYKTLKNKFNGNPQKLRIPPFFGRLKNKILRKNYGGNNWHGGNEIIKDGGWHFTFLGGEKGVKTKIKNYPHMDFFSTKKDLRKEKIKEDIKEGKFMNKKLNYLEIDNTFPESIIKNKKKYSHLIKKL
jgi:beta-1,4-mannosyl-glycoprotein beta-1,4-N-acetylglucosaminyltransferase